MAHPITLLVEATTRVARSYYHAIFLSALWLPAQLLIITGPPATAVLFAMARHDSDEISWNGGNARHAFQELFGPAWRWALVNLPLAGLLVLWPFSVWWPEAGLSGLAARLLWGLMGVIWLGANLFYWPAWLAAAEPSLRSGYRGSLQFWRQRPVVALYVFLVCFLVGAISLPLLLPLALGVVFWIAMAAELAFSDTFVKQKLPR